MITEERVREVVFRAIDDFNSQSAGDQKLIKSMDTVLFGKEGALDSIGLVNFIVAVEQQIEENFATVITLADEKAMSQKRSPFRTILSLADYVAQLLKENGNEK